MTDLEAAWNEIHDAKPDGWFVGTPVYIERRGWEQYAFDTRERHKHGRRTREWTAVAQSELEVVREMARCLLLIRRGPDPDLEKRPDGPGSPPGHRNVRDYLLRFLPRATASR